MWETRLDSGEGTVTLAASREAPMEREHVDPVATIQIAVDIERTDQSVLAYAVRRFLAQADDDEDTGASWNDSM
jgi:hypothetical protein